MTLSTREEPAAPLSTPAPQTLFRRYHDITSRLRVPAKVQIELTRVCNERCRHCNLASYHDRAPLTLAEYDRLFGQMREAGALLVNFTGGEATLRPDFVAISERAFAHRLSLSLNTNATHIDDTLAAHLARLRFGRVQVSVYGAKAETHDRMTRLPGSYAATWHGLRALARHRVPVMIAMSVVQGNADELEELRRQAEGLGAAVRHNARLFIRDKQHTRNAGCALPIEEQTCLVAEHITVHKEAADPHQHLCGAGINTCFISADGEVFPCFELPVKAGDVRRQHFADIWRDGSVIQELQRTTYADIPECADCEALAYCDRCPGEAFKLSGTIQAPDLNACQRAFALRDAVLAKTASRETSAHGLPDRKPAPVS